MSSNIYILTGKSNNINSELSGDRVSIGVMVFGGKILWHSHPSCRQIEVASKNDCEYYIEKLNRSDSAEGECVFKRLSGQIESSEGSKSPEEPQPYPVGFLVNKKIQDHYVTYPKNVGRVSVEGRTYDYSRRITFLNGVEEFYMDDALLVKIQGGKIL